MIYNNYIINRHWNSWKYWCHMEHLLALRQHSGETSIYEAALPNLLTAHIVCRCIL